MSKLFLVGFFLLLALFASYPTQVFASGNPRPNQPGVVNIQVTSPVVGGAVDRNGECVRSAQYNNHFSESWLAVDPTNPNHFVGMSKFFYDPEYYLFHDGASVSWDAGRTWKNTVVQGFDCRSNPGNSWVSTTDPNVAFDSHGTAYSAILPFNLMYNSTGQQFLGQPTDAIYVVKSSDGGSHWNIANRGLALQFDQNDTVQVDKQWVAVDSSPSSPFRDNVYAAWTVFNPDGSSDIVFSRSTDHGNSFSPPLILDNQTINGAFPTFVLMSTAQDGTLYATFLGFSATSSSVDVWLVKSTDGGRTFSQPRHAASFTALNTFDLPNTTFRDGVLYTFTVDPKSGNLFLAFENDSGNGLDVLMTVSTDGGYLWSRQLPVNDYSTRRDGTDQFQPTVAASSDGTVAVAFYDRRNSCPANDPGILREDVGRSNFCIDTYIQFYKDSVVGPLELGHNVRASLATWDPENPGRTTGQLPRPGGPLGNETFIGDYFGLALSNGNAYVLSVSNHNFGRNHANNQEQVLAIVKIPTVEGLTGSVGFNITAVEVQRWNRPSVELG